MYMKSYFFGIVINLRMVFHIVYYKRYDCERNDLYDKTAYKQNAKLTWKKLNGFRFTPGQTDGREAATLSTHFGGIMFNLTTRC